MANPMTTAGDLIYGGASGAAARRAVGSNGQVLMVVGGVPAWATPASGASVGFMAKPDTGTAQPVSNGTFTKMLFQTEQFDTGAGYDASTSRFQPTTAGKYLIVAGIGISHLVADAGKRLIAAVYKNGASVGTNSTGLVSALSTSTGIAILVDLNGSTDYVEVYGRQDTGAAQNFDLVAPFFGAYYQGT
ncbi:hypothetical protein D9M69_532870 [compost metagenome]